MDLGLEKAHSQAEWSCLHEGVHHQPASPLTRVSLETSFGQLSITIQVPFKNSPKRLQDVHQGLD